MTITKYATVEITAVKEVSGVAVLESDNEEDIKRRAIALGTVSSGDIKAGETMHLRKRMVQRAEIKETEPAN